MLIIFFVMLACSFFVMLACTVLHVDKPLCDVGLYRMTMITQELGKIEAKEGESLNVDLYPVGTMLFIYPFHVSPWCAPRLCVSSATIQDPVLCYMLISLFVMLACTVLHVDYLLCDVGLYCVTC
eukprot:TRINITY_DN66921_c0_g1_i2.p1 TRINITY_DN66921_c0_g1~~TRINITY_DN66921_c0_g1_i2.p1  ORF type:complete len:125 (+),score=9.88 TRINITY_DN66921_c0_g1_i2:49-423(+)